MTCHRSWNGNDLSLPDPTPALPIPVYQPASSVIVIPTQPSVQFVLSSPPLENPIFGICFTSNKIHKLLDENSHVHIPKKTQTRKFETRIHVLYAKQISSLLYDYGLFLYTMATVFHISQDNYNN